MNTDNTVCCNWCGISLGNASNVTFLNGNLPVCDLCLIKAKSKDYTETGWWEECPEEDCYHNRRILGQACNEYGEPMPNCKLCNDTGIVLTPLGKLMKEDK